jgi:hypothetical protein
MDEHAPIPNRVQQRQVFSPFRKGGRKKVGRMDAHAPIPNRVQQRQVFSPPFEGGVGGVN